MGDPFDPQTQMGPLAMDRQRDRVEGYIAKGIAEGATLATGGGRPKDLERGYYIEPTVFGNVDNQSTIAREEIFGPVLSVIPADNEDHAVTLANDTIYGLNASVFTNDVNRARQVAGQLRSGTVGHNAFRTDFGMAFGGFKQSGLGREGGTEGLLPFLETKTVILNGEPSSPRRGARPGRSVLVGGQPTADSAGAAGVTARPPWLMVGSVPALGDQGEGAQPRLVRVRPGRQHDLVRPRARLQFVEALGDDLRVTDQVGRHGLFDDRSLGRRERILRRLFRGGQRAQAPRPQLQDAESGRARQPVRPPSRSVHRARMRPP